MSQRCQHVRVDYKSVDLHSACGTVRSLPGGTSQLSVACDGEWMDGAAGRLPGAHGARPRKGDVAVRAEETGNILDAGTLPLVLAMHQCNPDGAAAVRVHLRFRRLGRDASQPRTAQAHRTHLGQSSYLPPDTVDYAAKATTVIEQDSHFTINGWNST